ncbi:MAG: double-strand break repair helicase AddA [Rhodospirillales bacterium]|nr:double-strand break repair helicase AddA [Rhodospirillales bacterium]
MAGGARGGRGRGERGGRAVSVLADEAALDQRRAADPQCSVWVSASAGSGKTKVLVDRLLNLLLAGVAPARILCLTFTKAAAAEMANRLADLLALWAIADDEALDHHLTKLTGQPPDAPMRTRARRLFAQVLDAPGGLAIQTLHAFCQSVLARFPLEAGVAPHFAVLDERDAAELLAQAERNVLARARPTIDPALAQALDIVTGRLHARNFPDLLGELARQSGRLARLIERHHGLDGLMGAIERRLGLDPGETPEAMIAAGCAEARFAAAALRQAVAALERGSAKDKDKGRAIAAWLAADPEARAARFADYQGAFLTKSGQPFARPATKEAIKAWDGLEAALQTEADRLAQLREREKAALTRQATAALLTLGGAILEDYRRAKAGLARLDYDDLILAARRLIEEGAAWVLYKLDGGIDHILIDEAQDTNPDQWAVARALVAEMFAGQGAERPTRTIFAVGDVKQSIYGFQGADPQEFESMRLMLEDRLPKAGHGWRTVGLAVSFRAAPALLQAVDAVFDDPKARDGLDLGQGYPRHLAHRQTAGGRVELWPPIQPKDADQPEPWKPPVERVAGDSPRARLAGLLARHIKAMIGREPLPSCRRAARPGDILVLVRRRNAFVVDLVRELKALEVPVAGVDRLVLTEAMAVMDLMALGRVALLPEDDLALAAVLKSPLVGLGEDDLFDLAHGREGRLWAALEDAKDRPPFGDALASLAGFLAEADWRSPHDLYARLLGPGGGRKRLLAALGPEAGEPIDEFLNLALAFEARHPASLQGFLAWLEGGATEIKRDPETGEADAVRIMTVHGAKGLEAPIVILPDTRGQMGQGSALVWSGAGEAALPLWAPAATWRDRQSQAARDQAKAADGREANRLLYVAMTRAADRLIVCGWDTNRRAPDGNWHDRVRLGLERIGRAVESPELAADRAWPGGPIWVVEGARPEGEMPLGPPAPPPPPALPAWADRPAPPEPKPAKPLIPSRPALAAPPPLSPLAPEGSARYRRGQLIHRLLQTLPDRAPADRARLGRRFLDRQAGDLDAAARTEMLEAALAVLDHPDWAPLFGPRSQAEAPIVGQVGERVIRGRIDRLAVLPDAVWIADYKTDRLPPRAEDAIPEAYRHQLQAYRALAAGIWPERPIRTFLIWTEGPVLTEIK